MKIIRTFTFHALAFVACSGSEFSSDRGIGGETDEGVSGSSGHAGDVGSAGIYGSGPGGTAAGGDSGSNGNSAGSASDGGQGGDPNMGGTGGSDIGGSSSSGGSSGAAGTGSTGGSSAGTGGQGQGGSTAGSSGSGGQGGTGGSTGGTSGSGGSVSGGSGGSNQAGSGGSGGIVEPDPCDNDDYIVCDTFEDDPLGIAPGAPWLGPMAECQDPDKVIAVSNAQSHSTSKSLLSRGIVDEACTLHADLGSAQDIYVRAWVRLTVEPGQYDRTSFFSVAPERVDWYHSVKVGLAGNFCPPGTLALRVEGDEHFLGCTGTPITANTWTCLELHVTTGPSGTTGDLSVNGEDQAYTVNGLAKSSVAALEEIPPTYLKVGSDGDGAAYDPSIYIDDVAVSTSPIGCD